MRPEDFDVQQRSPYTPEGQIEAAGHFARGVGGERLRRWVGYAFFGTLALIAIAAVLELTA